MQRVFFFSYLLVTCRTNERSGAGRSVLPLSLFKGFASLGTRSSQRRQFNMVMDQTANIATLNLRDKQPEMFIGLPFILSTAPWLHRDCVVTSDFGVNIWTLGCLPLGQMSVQRAHIPSSFFIYFFSTSILLLGQTWTWGPQCYLKEELLVIWNIFFDTWK